jgi:hypothetical protein
MAANQPISDGCQSVMTTARGSNVVLNLRIQSVTTGKSVMAANQGWLAISDDVMTNSDDGPRQERGAEPADPVGDDWQISDGCQSVMAGNQ